MRQRVSAPDAEALCGLFAERALGVYLGRIGADEGDREVEDGPALQDEADASEYAVHLPVGSETVAVDQRQASGLFDQLFVFHDSPPSLLLSPAHPLNVHNWTYARDNFAHAHQHNYGWNLVERSSCLRNGACGGHA